MKIRIKGNSIRYRLTKSEVAVFCDSGYFEDTVDFVTKKLTYAIQAKNGIDILDAEFKNTTITLFLNKQKSKDWYQSN